MDHYRYHRFYVTRTLVNQFIDAMHLFPGKRSMPYLPPDDSETNKSTQLLQELINTSPVYPLKTPKPNHMDDLLKLATIFEKGTHWKGTLKAQNKKTGPKSTIMKPIQ